MRREGLERTQEPQSQRVTASTQPIANSQLFHVFDFAQPTIPVDRMVGRALAYCRRGDW